jgi:protein-S-isoprenylcysteine O-methyltransferase Ste14
VTAPNLELKIPPVIVAVIFIVLMWMLAVLLPGFAASNLFRFGAYVVLIAAGAVFSVAGVVSFKKASTTVNPKTPAASSVLVTTGIYKSSRNPMYLGFLFFLIGWGLFLSNLYSLALCAGFVLYMNRFQIQPEEKILEAAFGAEFLAYKEQVRRWL